MLKQIERLTKKELELLPPNYLLYNMRAEFEKHLAIAHAWAKAIDIEIEAAPLTNEKV